MAEQRLIDVNPLVSGMKGRLKRYEKEYGYLSDFVSGYEEAIDDVVDTPTVEAKPVVHAHWNDDGRCTNCGEHAPFLLWADTWYESKYCHGCGAQMDEVVVEENATTTNNTQKVSVDKPIS